MFDAEINFGSNDHAKHDAQHIQIYFQSMVKENEMILHITHAY